METWTSDPLALATVACALAAGAILVWFLAARPGLSPATKALLLFGIGLLPIGAATMGNLRGFEETKRRRFCGSCHVMGPYARDLADEASQTLAAQHARNASFGHQACYACHRDYGMYGTVTTKIGGLRHVWAYVAEYRDLPVAESLRRIRLYRPYPNDNCQQCHSMRLVAWREVADHAALADEIATGRISCVSEGCHGPAHPFSKETRP